MTTLFGSNCNSCTVSCPSSPPSQLTNIAIGGTGPFSGTGGIGVFISFIINNNTNVVAQNVRVVITVDSGNVTILGVPVATIGTPIVFNNIIIWDVGTLGGGQTGTITFQQIFIAGVPNPINGVTWRAVASTSTIETTIQDNAASIFVPLPG